MSNLFSIIIGLSSMFVGLNSALADSWTREIQNNTEEAIYYGPDKKPIAGDGKPREVDIKTQEGGKMHIYTLNPKTGVHTSVAYIYDTGAKVIFDDEYDAYQFEIVLDGESLLQCYKIKTQAIDVPGARPGTPLKSPILKVVYNGPRDIQLVSISRKITGLSDVWHEVSVVKPC